MRWCRFHGQTHGQTSINISLTKSNMMDDRFWAVGLGQEMGPLVLGLSRNEWVEIVRTHGFKSENVSEVDVTEVFLEEIKTTLSFSAHVPQTLLRIDVYDSRARFDKLEVLGTPIHELVLLLKVSPAETRLLSIRLQSIVSMPGTMVGDRAWSANR